MIKKLNEEIVKAVKDPAARELLENQAMQPVGNTPEEFAAFIQKDIAVWKDAAAAAKVTVEQPLTAAPQALHRRALAHAALEARGPARKTRGPLQRGTVSAAKVETSPLLSSAHTASISGLTSCCGRQLFASSRSFCSISASFRGLADEPRAALVEA